MFLINLYKEIFQILNRRQKIKFFLMIGAIIITGFLDVIGLAAILPVIYIAAEPEEIFNNQYIYAVYSHFGFQSPEVFLGVAVIALFFIFLFKNIAFLAMVWVQARFAFGLAENLSKKHFNNYINFSFLEFKKFNSNLIVNHVSTIPSVFSTNVVVQSLILLSEFFVIFLLVVGAALVDINLFLILAGLLIPATVLFYKLIRDRVASIGEEKNDRSIEKNKALYQTMHGIVDVKINLKEKFFEQTFTRNLYVFYKLMVKYLVYQNLPTKFIEMVAIFGIVVIFMYALFISANTASLIAFLVLFATIAYRTMPSMNRILTAVLQIKSTTYAIEIIRELQKKSLENGHSEKEIVPVHFNHEIRLKDVSFAYTKGDKDFAIRDINLSVPKGSTIGFIGTSGSGKTTIFNILLRLLKEDSGKVMVDGVPLTDDLTPGWRQHIGYVRQDFYLTDGTLAENIAFGFSIDEIDMKKLNESIRSASLQELVDQLPDGVLTKIGEFGGNLSGGQRQRIAIARALYKEAEVLLFDEATSALDNETEDEIIDTIHQLAGTKTILIIAHRYTTLKSCDKIYEMKNGRVANSYSYKELMERKLEVKLS